MDCVAVYPGLGIGGGRDRIGYKAYISAGVLEVGGQRNCEDPVPVTAVSGSGRVGKARDDIGAEVCGVIIVDC